MANLDTLSIEITADSKEADKALKKLSKGLSSLSKSLKESDTSKLNAITNNISKLASLSDKATGIKNLTNSLARLSKATKEIDTTKLVSLTSSVSALINSSEGKDKNGLYKLSSALTRVSEASKEVDTTKFNQLSIGMNNIVKNVNGENVKAMTNFSNSITRLSKASSSVDGNGLANLSKSLNVMTNSFNGDVKQLSVVSRFTSALARLASAGNNTSVTAKSLPMLSKSLVSFFWTMKLAPKVATETTTLTQAIAQLSSAGVRAGKTSAALDTLADKTYNFIEKLSKAPEVSEKTVRLVTALGQLANAGSKANSVFNALAGGARRNTSFIDKLKRGISSLTHSFNRNNASATNLISTIGRLYAKYYILIRVFRGLGSSIKSSMAYIETLNYYTNTLDSLKSTSNENWQKIGFESAETYAKSFEERAKTLTKKMSGYAIGKNGALEMTNMPSMGIDPNLLMNYQSVFTQMSKSLGLANTNASKLGQILPEIGADMASLYNKNFTDVWDDLQSGITGMARTWDKYGTNIRVANLQEMATRLGIQQTVTTMSQADKVLLRTIMLLDSQRAAWTDLATTINQPENQLRMVKAQFANLSRTIGDIFLPIIATILPYLNAVLILLNKAASAVAKFIYTLTGFNPGELTGKFAPTNDGLSDMLDNTEDVADATKKATKATKEWQNQLLGFDEINKLDEDKGNGKDSGVGKNPVGMNSALQDAFDKIYEEYQKAWNDAYDSMDNKAQKLAKKLQKALIDAWNTNDGSKLGKSVAKWLNKGLDASEKIIPTFTEGFKRVAKILATGINGFVENYDWSKLGKVVGKSIKGVLEGVGTFLDTVNWFKLGKSISKTLNAFVSSGVFQQYMKTFASQVRSAIQFALGAISNFDFKGLGKTLGESINAFLKKMGKVDKDTGLTGWQELGRSISKGISGILDAINEALSTVDWEEVGKAVGDFLSEIEWAKILAKTAKAIGLALVGALKAWVSTSGEGKIVSVIAALFVGKGIANKLGLKLGKNTIGATVGKSILDGIGKKVTTQSISTTIGTAAEGASVGATNSSKLIGLGSKAGGWVLAGIATAVVGFNIGKWLYKQFGFVRKWADNLVELGAELGGWILDGLEDWYNKKVVPFIKKVEGIFGKKENKHTFTVNMEGNAETKTNNVKNNLDDFAKTYGTYGTGVTVKVDANTTDADTKLNNTTTKANNLNKLKPEVKPKVVTPNIEDFKSKISKQLQSANLSVSIAAKLKNTLSALNSGWQKELNSTTLTKKVSLEIDGTKKKVQLHFNADSKSSNYGYTWLTEVKQKKDGGIFKNGRWSNIQKFASGGIPNRGQMFIAREAGAELVGTMPGGGTGVINNDQIVASVAKGVASAVEVAMRNANNSNRNDSYIQTSVQIDGREVLNSMLKAAKVYKAQTGGTNAFMTV